MIYEKELSDKLIGLALEVYKTLGSGFLEGVYQEALSIELEQSNLQFEQQKELSIKYKNRILNKKYYADFIVENKIILELKTVECIDNIHIAQVINYLKSTGLKVGYIINFGAAKFEFKRIVY